MEKTTNPTVKDLAIGEKLTAKQMQAKANDLLPEHIASLESILLIQEGECTFRMDGKERTLKQGDAIIVPAEIKHQIKAKTDFKAVHFMPSNIKFKFFN